MNREGLSIDAGGAWLHVEDIGNPNGRPILFLHGGAGTLEDFERLLPFLGDRRFVLADSRGHGASTLGGETLSYPRLAQDAAIIIAALGLKRPFVVGHSDGGIAGIHLATMSPLAGLVTIGAHATAPGAEAIRTIFAPLTPAWWREKFPEGVELYESLNPEPDFERLFTAISAMWQDDRPGNYPAQLARRVSCPTLVLGGDLDHLVPRELSVELAELIPNARLGIFPYASHMPHRDLPEHTADFITTFFERIEQGT